MKRLLWTLALVSAGLSAAADSLDVGEQEWIDGHSLVVLQNDLLVVTVAPAFGGRVVSMVYRPTNTEIFSQEALEKLPDVDAAVAEAREIMSRLATPEPRVSWSIGGDVAFSGTPVWDFLSVKGPQLWGWLECLADRRYGGYQGNEHHSAIWSHRIIRSAGEVGVEVKYTTQLPPAPLEVVKRYTLAPRESKLRTRHTITNVGEKEQRFEYYPHGCFTPGGAFEGNDRLAVPIKSADGTVSARVVPTWQERGGCVLFHAAAPWVAYVDSAARELIVHYFGYESPVGWSWNGRTQCSLEPLNLLTLAPGASSAWEGYLGVTQGFTSITGVAGDVAADIEAADKGDTIEVVVTVASFDHARPFQGAFTLAGEREGLPSQSIEIAFGPEAISTRETLVIEKARLPEGRYNACLSRGEQVIAERAIDIPLVDRDPRAADGRKVVWIMGPHVFLPEHLKNLYGIETVELGTTFLLTDDLLDPEKTKAVVFADRGPRTLKAHQCERLLDYVRAGGRLVILPRGSASFEGANVAPEPKHLTAFFDALGVGPALSERINPNRLERGSFRVRSESVVDHALTRGLDWDSLELAGLWRYRLGDDAQVLARLDTGDPLVVVRPLGKGEVVLFCAPTGIVTLGWGGFGAGFDEFLRRCLDEKFDATR